MIKEVTMYTVICDRCGKDACQGTDWSAWGDKFDAEDVALDADWIQHEGKDYCTDCIEWNEDETELIPKP